MKIETHGAKELFCKLKERWDLSRTILRENESDIVIMFYSPNTNMYVAYYCKQTKIGVVYDRRKIVRLKI